MYPFSLLAAGPVLGGMAAYRYGKHPVGDALLGTVGGSAGTLTGALGGEALQLLLEALLYRATKRPALVKEITQLTRHNLPVATALAGGYLGGALTAPLAEKLREQILAAQQLQGQQQ